MKLIWSTFLPLVLSGAIATARVVLDTSLELPWFLYEGSSHFEFGLELGKAFKDDIVDRLQLSSDLKSIILPFYATDTGKAIYDKYLNVHNSTFPDYVEELQGIAAGSGVPFETLFLMNIVEEYSNSLPQPSTFQKQMHCSDLTLHTADLCVVGHNEDSGFADVNHTAIVTAKIGGNPWFTAYTYLGDLPTGAFGANEHGIAFSMNYVEPLDIEVGGLGRGFISRDLLLATDYSDAIARITRPHQAAGHNFQLMDVSTTRVYNVEVASFNRSNVREIAAGVPAFFHTNQYQSMLIRQPARSSSYHRLRRYAHMSPPTSVASILSVLGDQGDKSFPVFHDENSHRDGELSNWTLLTVIFDVKNGVAYLLQPRVNPQEAHVMMVLDLLDVQKLTLLHAVPDQVVAQTNMLLAKKNT
ncbi:unnamed protein product [Aphanomyces euteiches]